MDLVDLGPLGRWEPDFSRPTLFKRCANCPPQPPPCPVCAENEVCTQITGGCDQCPITNCTSFAAPSAVPSKPSSPAGPIAGGVIGGIVLVCLLTFLFWRFFLRKRRQQFDEQLWQETETEKGEDDFQSQRGRASMHSVRSIASTVLTRASNVIQIAYIPGVTNRSVESTPDLIPPVPPIPAMSAFGSTAGTPQQPQDEHFFMPSDLRNSTYSDYTVDRESYARTSMTPSLARGSVPSTAYRGSAVVNTLPAQTAIRGKANPVAVKSNGKDSPSGSSRSGTPTMPSLEKEQQNSIRTNTTSPIVARLGVPKTVTVTRSNGNLAAAAAIQKSPSPLSSGPSPLSTDRSHSFAFPDRKVSVADSRHDGNSSTFDDASSSDEESPADRSLMGHEKLPRFSRLGGGSVKSPSSAPDLRLTPSPNASSSPDSMSRARKQKHKRSGSLNQIIEEATRRASKEPRHGGLGSVGNVLENYDREVRGSREGPFSDSNAAKTP